MGPTGPWGPMGPYVDPLREALLGPGPYTYFERVHGSEAPPGGPLGSMGPIAIGPHGALGPLGFFDAIWGP